MAIKGKSRTKGRPKQPARAPRRAPVAVKPAFAQRRWVQVTAAFVVGAFAMVLLVWVTNGLREDHASSDTQAQASKRRTAAVAWQSEVVNELSKVGTATTQGALPTLFTDMSGALAQMSRSGTAPDGATRTFQKASDGAQAVVTALSNFDLAGAISDHGFNVPQTLAFTDSKDRLVAAIALYKEAADVATQAVGTQDHAQRAALTKIATDLQTNASTDLQQAWETYTESLAAGGIADTGQGPGLGLPGSGG
jgi:hypothetical protein